MPTVTVHPIRPGPHMTDMLTSKKLAYDLERLGLAAGDHVAIGVSLRSLGPLSDGPTTLIDALLDVVGPYGTVMANAYTNQYPLSVLRSGRSREKIHPEIFDASTTPANTGVIPNVLLARPESRRSTHPTNSVVAIGASALTLTESHTPDAPAYSPYSTLAGLGGKFLAVGLGKHLVGLRHEAQYLAGLLSVIPPYVGVRYLNNDGRIQLFIRKDKGGCVRRLPDFVDPLIDAGHIKYGQIGRAQQSLLVDVSRVLKEMTDLLKEFPARNLCAQVDCLWCRETERRLNIHHEARPTGRDRTARLLITGVNRYRTRFADHPRAFAPLWRVIRSLSTNYGYDSSSEAG